MEVIRHPANQALWPTLGVRDNILVEQYFLAACLEYHQQHRPGGADRLGVETLFPSSAEAFRPHAATRAGYTHLIGGAKSNPAIAARLEQRLRRDHPHHYRRCLDWAAWHLEPAGAEAPPASPSGGPGHASPALPG